MNPDVTWMEYEELIKDVNNDKLCLIIEKLRDEHVGLIYSYKESERIKNSFITEYDKLKMQVIKYEAMLSEISHVDGVVFSVFELNGIWSIWLDLHGKKYKISTAENEMEARNRCSILNKNMESY